MEPETSGYGNDAVAGLIVEDGNGHYFAIAWEALLRFRVPNPYVGAVQALLLGAEPPAGEPEVRGHGGAEPAGGVDPLLAEVVAGTAPGGRRLAARRLSTWALLR